MRAVTTLSASGGRSLLHPAIPTINRLRRLSRPREYHTVGRHDNDAVTLTAYIERICGMIGVFVTFRCGDKFDDQAVRKIAETARVSALFTSSCSTFSVQPLLAAQLRECLAQVRVAAWRVYK